MTLSGCVNTWSGLEPEQGRLVTPPTIVESRATTRPAAVVPAVRRILRSCLRETTQALASAGRCLPGRCQRVGGWRSCSRGVVPTEPGLGLEPAEAQQIRSPQGAISVGEVQEESCGHWMAGPLRGRPGLDRREYRLVAPPVDTRNSTPVVGGKVSSNWMIWRPTGARPAKPSGPFYAHTITNNHDPAGSPPSPRISDRDRSSGDGT